jgi:4,5-DOPA dioxygenase extradiol
MSALNAFDALPATPRMPALFVGHGNPMNAIEDNSYARTWAAIGEKLPAPKAVLCVSAHWMTRGVTLVHVGAKPKTIHDFGGFPAELFAQQYPAPGAPEIAQASIDLVRGSHLKPDSEWGLDHGAWSVLMNMFPKADIPVFQLSLDLTKSLRQHFELARELKRLREKGVLIIGSGNLVHNLMALAPGAEPYDWAQKFDAKTDALVEARDFAGIQRVDEWGRLMRLAHPSAEHFLPLVYALGVADEKEEISRFNVAFDMASISMRSYLFS